MALGPESRFPVDFTARSAAQATQGNLMFRTSKYRAASVAILSGTQRLSAALSDSQRHSLTQLKRQIRREMTPLPLLRSDFRRAVINLAIPKNT
jgi:hypothetical protein